MKKDRKKYKDIERKKELQRYMKKERMNERNDE